MVSDIILGDLVARPRLQHRKLDDLSKLGAVAHSTPRSMATNGDVRRRIEEAVAAEIQLCDPQQRLSDADLDEIIGLVTDKVFKRMVDEMRPVLNDEDRLFMQRRVVDQIVRIKRDDESAQLRIELAFLLRERVQERGHSSLYVRAFLALRALQVEHSAPLKEALPVLTMNQRTLDRLARPSELPPVALCCSITQDLMRDPVVTCDGHTYERKAIEKWLSAHETSPNTGQTLRHKELAPNVMARGLVQAWLQEQAWLKEQPQEEQPRHQVALAIDASSHARWCAAQGYF